MSFQDLFSFERIEYSKDIEGIIFYEIKLLKNISNFKKDDLGIFAILYYKSGQINIVFDEDGNEELILKPNYDYYFSFFKRKKNYV